MRGFRVAAMMGSISAMVAAAFHHARLLDFRPETLKRQKDDVAELLQNTGHSYRRTARPDDNRAISAQRFDPARLALDRSTSIHKLQRWARAGQIELPQPTERSLQRHGWYRRKLRMEAEARVKAKLDEAYHAHA